MLLALDHLLQDLLLRDVPSLSAGQPASLDQVAFTPPDASWRNAVSALGRPALAVHLLELRENARLRSSERFERVEPGGQGSTSQRAPYRLDCHYVIAAAPVTTSSGGPPAQHALLYEVTAALVNALPLIPSRVYAPATPALQDWPGPHLDAELPLFVNPPAGLEKQAEFWGTLEGSHPWQPLVHAVVTLPVELTRSAPVGLVRRAMASVQPGGQAERVEAVGGLVLDRQGRAVPGATVVARDAFGELARAVSGQDGRYLMPLSPGATGLQAAAFGLGATPVLTLVPPVDDFTLRFT